MNRKEDNHSTNDWSNKENPFSESLLKRVPSRLEDNSFLPTGPLGSLPTDYGMIFNFSFGMSQTTAPGRDVIFNGNGSLSGGISHTLGTSSIHIANGGIYMVVYQVSAEFSESNNSMAYSLTINGSTSIPTTSGHVGVPGTSGTVVNYTILPLENESKLTLRNVSNQADDLLALVDGKGTVNAVVSLFRLS